MKNQLRIILLCIALTGIFQFTHEAGHVVVASAYGSQSNWGFSSVIQIWDTPPQNPSEWQEITLPVGATGWVKYTPPESHLASILFDSMGPIFSLSVFLIFFALFFFVKSDEKQKILLIGIFLLGFTLGFYYLRASNSYWGDEKSLAYYLGVSEFLFNIPLTIVYFAGMIFAAIQLYKRNFGIGQFLIAMLTTIATGISMNRSQILVTQQVDNGNALFNSFLGFSLPVLLFFLMCFVVFAYIWRKEFLIDL